MARANDHHNGWLVLPSQLHALLVDPEPAYIDDFVQQIDLYLDGMAAEQPALYEAVGPGKQYLRFLKEVQTAPLAYKLFAALVFLQCVPPARSRLQPKDVAFMQQFSAATGLWLLGKGELSTVAFVCQQAQVYRWEFAHTTGVPSTSAMVKRA